MNIKSRIGGPNNKGGNRVSLVNRIEKLQKMIKRPLTDKEIEEIAEWGINDWLPYDEEANALVEMIINYARSKQYPCSSLKEILYHGKHDDVMVDLMQQLDNCLMAYFQKLRIAG